MLTSKQRSKLKSLANDMDAVITIGKKEISDNLLTAIIDVLDKRELIKISILQNSDIEPKSFINELCSILEAEPVLAIGKKMIIYRRSKKKGVKHIEID